MRAFILNIFLACLLHSPAWGGAPLWVQTLPADAQRTGYTQHVFFLPQTVGAIVRGYKSAVTKQLGLMGLVGKLWQRNYWEHIIRDESSYIGISDYIINNPAKWADDKFYSR